jgi:hypothetical protein
MSHNLDYLPWMRHTRRRMTAALITALGILLVTEFVYSGLSAVPMFSVAQSHLANVIPWVESVCGLASVTAAGALATTWSASEWWVERWARTYESFVG